MRYGIFSDVHSNLPALEAVLAAYEGEAIDKYVCAGDIVGYAADPAECIRQVKQLNPILVAGNHDWACVDLLDTSYFNPVAKKAVEWTGQQLAQADKSFLKSLPLTVSHNDFLVVHGTLDNPQDFNYLIDQMDARLNFGLMPGSLCLVGHTHVPGVFVKEDENIRYLNEYPLKIFPSRKYIINVGSVGQPRDGNWQAGYAVLDTSQATIEIKRIGYDIEEAQRRIIKAGLPHFLAERLSAGR